ncbi:MAG: alpha/beta hydrolase [Tepidisphaeraceae bacterium]
MAYLSLALFLILVAVGWSGLLILMMARRLLRPPRMNDGKAMYLLKRLSPEDLGLAFDPIGFTVMDAQRPGQKIRLAGWWIPAAVASDRVVIILHGYADAKVGGIAWAPTWHGLGWNVLAIDLRAHGESGGEQCTAGYFERDDVDQIINAIRQEKPQFSNQVALFGVSLGAAVACAVAARREDIAAVVLDSPYADYLGAVHAHGERMSMPLECCYSLAYRAAEWLSGARFDEVRPVELIPQIACPLLVIHGTADVYVPDEQVERIQQAMTRREGAIRQHAHVEGAQHVLSLRVDPSGYAERIRQFLELAPKISVAERT